MLNFPILYLSRGGETEKRSAEKRGSKIPVRKRSLVRFRQAFAHKLNVQGSNVKVILFLFANLKIMTMETEAHRQKVSTPRPLTVSIVGAGLGGLAAAVALRQNGHQVQVFEAASDAKDNIGAAIIVPVNAQRVLEYIGYVPENIDPVAYEGTEAFDSLANESIPGRWLIPLEKPNLMCHRGDLHAELLRLATEPGASAGPPVTVRVSSRVVGCDPAQGSLKLECGDEILSDLVIGADGIGSFIRTSIVGEPVPSLSSGWSCSRAVIDMDAVRAAPELAWITEGISGARIVSRRRNGPTGVAVQFLYPIRGGRELNWAGVYSDDRHEDPDWLPWSPRATIEDIYSSFQPQYRKLLSLLPADPATIPKWQMRYVPLLPTWIRGRAALMGDAAHATLPILGQGAAIAIEEAGALGALFPAGTKAEDVEVRLKIYEALRKERGEWVGRESVEQAMVKEKMRLFYRTKEMQEFIFNHDAIKTAQEALVASSG
ncbi:Amidohydrolase family protein [Mycena chlorophos]|uniref:Amidohydrolase family protein n=1 Tax=Mycena chlorophos TaxID=658473 RepID=A0A8H6TQ12_MYCCL|nr:Amidohydrolase family protein [Mycena chlorophos]